MARITSQVFSIFIFVSLGCAAARSASVNVMPVRIELSAARPYAVLRLTNAGTERLTLHMRAYRWTFDERDDVLAETDDVILNPPLTTLAPQAIQIVRVGLRSVNEGDHETTYRLIVEEVPTSKVEVKGTAITTILRMSIPIFAQPRRPVAPKLEWSAHRDSDGTVKLVACNRGLAHVQIKSFLVSREGSPEGSEKVEGASYLLPSQRRQWTLKNPQLNSAPRLVVEALTDVKHARETFALDVN